MNHDRGLILDYGGVLTSSVFESFQEFCRSTELSWEAMRRVLIREATTEGSSLHRVETGHLQLDDFNLHLARAFEEEGGRSVDAAGLSTRMFAAIRPETQMIETVRELHALGVPTAMLSNSWGLDGYSEELRGLFDAIILSGEVGLRKPGAEIYLIAAEKIERRPAECVFVDDLAMNVEGAEAVGMTGILHREPPRTVERLRSLFE